MEELIIKVKYEKSKNHNPNEGTINEIIAHGLELYMEMDMEADDIVKEGSWSVEIQ
jgi:hypothetical protein